jgi:subtilisin
MRVASICAASALALGFVHSHALAEVPPPPQPNISQVEQARNTFIFTFDESVDRGEMHARAREIVADAGGTLRHVYPNLVGGFAATVPGTAVWNIAGRRDIIAFERDEIVTIAQGKAPVFGGGGSTETSETPWGVDRIMAPITETFDSIHAYVIDTGIDFNHEDLNVDSEYSWDCTAGCGKGGQDDHGHGTHVAGTIGAIKDGKDVVGVAPKVTLHSVKVLNSSGSGYESDIIAALELVAGQVDAVPVVANLSLGGKGSKVGTCDTSGWDGTLDSYHKAFCLAAHAGVVFVVAAGNDGADAEKLAPAAYDDAVITVSATHVNDDWPRWSNWGDNTASWVTHSVTSAPVTIAAPGVEILSTKLGGGTTTKSGTSMASPHVAGVAAILVKSGAYDTVNYKFEAGKFYNAFLNIRAAIIDTAADSFTTSLKGNKVHDEKFVCAVAGKTNCKEEKQ